MDRVLYIHPQPRLKALMLNSPATTRRMAMRSNNWRWTQTWLCFSLPMQLRWISIWRKPMPPEGAFWDMNMVGLSCRNAIGYTTCLILKCNSMIACFDLDLNEACTAYSSKFSTLQQGLQGTHPRTKWPFETIGVFQIHVTLKIHVLRHSEGGTACAWDVAVRSSDVRNSSCPGSLRLEKLTTLSSAKGY